MKTPTLSSRIGLLREDFNRLLDEVAGLQPDAGQEGDDAEPQAVPVNVFETENELMVVAAMPGIEAENIDIEVEDNYLTVRAGKRGPGQERHHYTRREWSYGPYERSIKLPIAVDMSRANASYGNGVLTVAMPKTAEKRARRLDITLDAVGSARGEHVGHRGKE